MELPRNVVQIGKPDKVHKIFVEDYVVSYIKQLNKACDGKAAGLALYGKFCEEEGCRYYFLYGASRIEGLEHRGPYLSQIEKEEIEDIGRKYFGEYEFLAWCSVKEDPVEGFFVQVQGKGVAVDGYACFYEKNESMLNFMLLSGEADKGKREERAEDKKAGRGEWISVDYVRVPQKQGQKQAEQPAGMPDARKTADDSISKKTGFMKIAVAAVFLVLCVVGITTLNDHEKLEDLQVVARQVIASLTEQKLPDALNQAGIDGEQAGAQARAGEEAVRESTAYPDGALVDGGDASAGEAAAGEATGTAETPDGTSAGSGTAAAGEATGTADISDGTSAGSGTAAAGEATGTADISDGTSAGSGTAATGEATGTSGTAASEAAAGNVVQPAPAASHVIVKGDTLISICLAQYGTLDKMQEICDLNGITNADSIQIGQTILLP